MAPVLGLTTGPGSLEAGGGPDEGLEDGQPSLALGEVGVDMDMHAHVEQGAHVHTTSLLACPHQCPQCPALFCCFMLALSQCWACEAVIEGRFGASGWSLASAWHQNQVCSGLAVSYPGCSCYARWCVLARHTGPSFLLPMKHGGSGEPHLVSAALLGPSLRQPLLSR